MNLIEKFKRDSDKVKYAFNGLDRAIELAEAHKCEQIDRITELRDDLLAEKKKVERWEDTAPDGENKITYMLTAKSLGYTINAYNKALEILTEGE